MQDNHHALYIKLRQEMATIAEIINQTTTNANDLQSTVDQITNKVDVVGTLIGFRYVSTIPLVLYVILALAFDRTQATQQLAWLGTSHSFYM